MVALFFPPPFGAPPVSSMAFQASATSGATTVTCPTVVPYDVGVLVDWGYNFASPSIPAEVVPSGFTKVTGDTGASIYRGTVSYKVFNGSEGSSSITGMAAEFVNKTLMVFRPNGVVQTVSASTWLNEITTGNPGAQAISASGQAAPLIRFAAANVNVNTTPDFSAGSWDTTITNTGTSGVRQRVNFTIQNSSPSDDSADMVDYGTNWLTSGWLRFA